MVEPADVLFAADEINSRPRAVLDWSSATARFAVYHAAAGRSVQGAAEASQPLQLLLLRASGVVEELTELGFGVQGELLSVKEEGGSTGYSERFSA
ncbi:MAG: family transposase [Pseudarthrobacter sp.]|nr:family transposase [Pseudarthrobacter sp.]